MAAGACHVVFALVLLAPATALADEVRLQGSWAGRRVVVWAAGPDPEQCGAAAEPEGGGLAVLPDLTAEREVWRVEASRGRLSLENGGGGVFDLLFDWAEGSWRLARCLD